MKWILCLGLTTALWGSTCEAADRIVTLGGTITEIVFALGAGERVVGVDASSSFPEAVNQLPKVAYHRRLSAEGVLSLRPTLIIATTEAGPPEAIQQLESTGVTVLVLPHEPTVENAIAKIERIAAALERSSARCDADPNAQKRTESGTILHSTNSSPSQNSLSLRPRPRHANGRRSRHRSRYHDRPSRWCQRRSGL